MDDSHDRWAAQFPALYTRSYIDYAQCDIEFTTASVPDQLVSRLHLVAIDCAGKQHRHAGDRAGAGSTG